jgi:signal transduction histidine kinase
MNTEEKDLYQQIKQLQETNKHLLKQIDDLNKKLVESETFKSHFLSNITNEIVNPFASVMGLSQQIIELKEENRHKAAELAGLILSEAAALDFQLRNIFMAARLEAGEEKPEPSEINLQQLIDEIINKIKYLTDKKEISIRLNIDSAAGSFVSDKEKLELILLNLLSNAVKFSNSGKEIIVRVQTDTEYLTIEVEDEGIGMTQEETDRIFDRFHRADPVIQSITPGSGLGLAVVEGLLFILNGKSKIDSVPGKGTTVRISLPEENRVNIELDDELFIDDQPEESF